jgi:GntR family transcriptional repressor for pyruvate dehydrogenase complex
LKITPVKRVNVSDAVVEQLLELIGSGELRPGSRLPPERELMTMFGVGRSSIREALRGLVLAGIVEAAPMRGTIVRSPIGKRLDSEIARAVMFWTIKDIYELRAVVEGYAAGIAAQRATPAQIRAIEHAHLELVRKVRIGSLYFKENIKFHLEIAAASGNSALLYCLRSIIGSFRETREQMDVLQSVPEVDISDHQAILDAIRERNPERSRRMMEAHMRSSAERIKLPERKRPR